VISATLADWAVELQSEHDMASDLWRGAAEIESGTPEQDEERPAAAEYAEKFHSSEPYYKGPGGIVLL